LSVFFHPTPDTHYCSSSEPIFNAASISPFCSAASVKYGASANADCLNKKEEKKQTKEN
jgi:hypothetical protein